MGARISAHRKNKGLTQEALANTLGVSNQAVSKWESDVCCPDIALLPQLVDALEMTLDELFGRESKAAIANDQILPVAAELPWEDDDSIHAVLRGTGCSSRRRAVSSAVINTMKFARASSCTFPARRRIFTVTFPSSVRIR